MSSVHWCCPASGSCSLDLILNALALGFVIEIDELIFDAMFPAFMNDELSSVKLWRSRSSDPAAKTQVQWNAYRRSGIYWIILLLGVYVYLVVLQGLPFFGVLPGYEHDAHCGSYWKRKDAFICDSWSILKGANCFPFGVSDSEDLPPHPEVYR